MSTLDQMREERTHQITSARAVLARVKAAGRTNPSPAEEAEVQTAMDRVKDLDKQIKDRALVDSVVNLGRIEDPDDYAAGLKSSVFSSEASRELVSAVRTRSNYRTSIAAKAALVDSISPTAGDGIVPGLHRPESSHWRACSLWRGHRTLRSLLRDERSDRWSGS